IVVRAGLCDISANRAVRLSRGFLVPECYEEAWFYVSVCPQVPVSFVVIGYCHDRALIYDIAAADAEDRFYGCVSRTVRRVSKRAPDQCNRTVCYTSTAAVSGPILRALFKTRETVPWTGYQWAGDGITATRMGVLGET